MVEEEEEDGYFSTYSHFSIHDDMLKVGPPEILHDDMLKVGPPEILHGSFPGLSLQACILQAIKIWGLERLGTRLGPPELAHYIFAHP